MAISKLYLFLCVLSIATFVQKSAGINLFKPAIYFWPDSPEYRNFTSGSDYEKNLDLILHDLYNKTPATGFSIEYAGAAETSGRVYALALCRGDVSAENCKTCIAKIGRWVRGKSPFTKGVFAWFQGCILHYSDTHFFGKLDSDTIYILKKQNLSKIAPLKKVKKLLNHLAGEAYTSKKLFAKGVVKLARSKNLYGLVQCTLDLSPAHCKICIDELISTVASIYGRGTQYFTTTCTLQYMLYPFFDA